MPALSDLDVFRHSRADVCVGLIGSGIQASLTPAMHMQEGRAHGLDYQYRLIDTDVFGLAAPALPALISAAEDSGFAGLNITYPLKQAVLGFLTDLSRTERGQHGRLRRRTPCWPQYRLVGFRHSLPAELHECPA